ncbi:(d)CMP kinase [Candidatus Pelagibacter sp.]|nr:(d)CMP kinase [Candidatus Pelagibacter sp.]
MKKRKNIITVAIDSPAAAGAGTQAKLISKHYNLFYLDTGKIYRFIGNLKLKFDTKFTYNLVKHKINNLKLRQLKNKSLLSNEVALSASKIAKDKKIRNIVQKYQQKCAYNPPKKYNGSVLDGRDIITVQVKDAMFKFYITANLKIRAKRRFLEYKELNKKITYKEVLKSLRIRDKSDKERKYGPLKKTEDSILINTTKLSKKACFKKIKRIIDKKLIN